MISLPKTLGRLRRKLLAAAVALPVAAASAAPAPSWDVRKVNGEDFVPVEKIKQFYGFSKMSGNGGNIVLEAYGSSKPNQPGAKPGDDKKLKIVMNLRVGSPECTMNRVKFVFCRPVAEIDGKAYVSGIDLSKLIDPVLRPEFIKNAGDFRTVILDPGHGGKDPGETNPYGTEAGFNLKIANLVRSELLKLGYRVVMTRSTDTYVSLPERVNAANAITDPAIFVSLHLNSGSPAARGIETFTLSPPGVAHYGRGIIAADAQSRAGNQHDSANVALATSVHGMVTRGLGTNTFDRGIKHARYTVLSGVRHPAILLEGGFMSNAYEGRMIAKPEYQTALAKSVAAAVTRYRKAVSQQVAAPKKN